ncbi:hypothetical protein KUCAC02_032362 [Chaenocephalus aceratus]|nr:hypothetical protein KUCAC02_032362 [Chaenocephalus aceratus]
MEKVLLIIIALSGLSAASSHAERQYHFVSEAKSMSEAQRYCREKHTDLATVDSMEVVKLLNDMAGQHNQSAWIGLHDERDAWRWSMSDPSFYGPGETEFRRWARPNAAFVPIYSRMTWTDAQSYCREHHTDLASYWAANEPNLRASKVCVAAAFHNSGKWEDLDCGLEKPFICYGPVVPVSMQVIKVRVQKPNGVDLNDPAFLAAMLVEAKKNLRAQGLDDNVQVAWRKQPDGHVFHKEEEKRDEL